MNILLIHQYSGNKGDRAVLFSMCMMLKSLYPECSITVSTSDIDLWQGYKFYEENDIKFVPWAWDYINVEKNSAYWNLLKRFQKYTFTIMRETFLRGMNLSRIFSNPRFYKALIRADKVISVGGHHFTTLLSRDLVSSINFDMMAASVRHQVVCFSQSFGQFQFQNQRNKKLTQTLMARSILMPRENNSEEILTEFIGNSNSIVPTYETVLSIANHIDYIPVDKRDNAVGVAIYCTYGTQHRTVDETRKYKNTLAKFCDEVINKGFEVRFFPMEIKGSGPDDRPFINEIISLVNSKEKCFVYDVDMETLEHVQEVSKCKVFLGHKTHSTIFALSSGTPLIALAYHPKTIEFLHQFKMDDNVVDDKVLSSEWLSKTFADTIADLETISLNEYNTSQRMASKIESDLRAVLDVKTV